MTTFIADDYEAFMTYTEGWKKLEEKSIKKSFFDLFCKLYNSKQLEEEHPLKEMAYEIFECTVLCLQMVSVLWVPDLPIKNWHTNMILWELIGYSRLDNTCSKFEILSECLYLSVSITFLIFSLIVLFTLVIYYKRKFSPIIISGFKALFYIWKTFLFVPSTILFSIFLKYSFMSEKYILEYRRYNNYEKIEINSSLQIGLIVGIIICLFLVLSHIECSGEIRHYIYKKTIKAKAHSRIDKHTALFMFFISICYALFAENYIIHLQILAMLVSVTLMAEAMILMPYFSLFSSTLAICRFFCIALASFSFILGRLLDNSLAISIFSVVLGPLSAIFIIQFTKKLQSNINKKIPENLEKIQSEYDLEKSLRYPLCSNDSEQKDQIIYIFEIFYIDKISLRSNLQFIWVANYCLFTLKDESLAKIKLSTDWSLETNYQLFLCNKNIIEFYLDETLQFLSYFQLLSQVREEDKNLCFHLLKFWKEITLKKPNHKSLISELNSISEGILYLNKHYSKLTTDFFQSRESLALYASYVENILFDSEKSVLLRQKLASFDRHFTNSIKGPQSFGYFDSDCGILIISNEEKNFGDILYSNPKTSEILKTSENNIIGNNILNFVSIYYGVILANQVRNFVQFTSNSETDFSKGFFLNLPSNHLLECTGKSINTAFNNVLVTILIFKPKQTVYQVALISELNEICCYTEKFPLKVGKPNDNLIGFTLGNLFPELNESSLEPFKAYKLLSMKREKVLVMSYWEFYSLRVPYIMLIKSHEEALIWKNEETYKESYQLRHQVQLDSSASPAKNEENILSYNKRNKQQSEEDLTSKTNLYQSSSVLLSDPIIEPFDPLEDRMSQISATRYQKIIKTSSRSINILHTIFIISVNFIQILAVLATNIVVLSYGFYSIVFISDIDTPLTIGKVGKNLQNVGFMSKMLLMFNKYKSPSTVLATPLILSDLSSFLIELENIYSKVGQKIHNYQSCIGQDIFSDNSANLWYSEDGVYSIRTNLLNVISEFIKKEKDMLSKFNNSEDYSDEVSFLILNGYKESLRYCNDTLNDVVNCYKSKIDDFKGKMIILLVLGIFVFFMCICVMVPFCYFVLKTENNLWNNVRRKAFDCYSELSHLLLERMKEVHSRSDISITNKSPSKLPINFRSGWKYTWRISIYFIIVLAFSLVNITYLYENCINYLYYRPEVIKELINIQILHTGMGIWSTETKIVNLDLNNKYTFIYPFSNGNVELKEILSKADDSKLKLRNPKYSSILSNRFKENFYGNYSTNASESLAYGIYTVEDFLKFEAYQNSQSFGGIDLWLSLMRILSELNPYYDDLINDTDHYSQSVINSQMNIVLAALSAFIASSIIIYFGFYYIFFKKEKKYLEKINSIMKIIP